MLSFYSFFILASVCYGVVLGWMSPIVVTVAAVIVMFLIVMGTKLVSQSLNKELLTRDETNVFEPHS